MKQKYTLLFFLAFVCKGLLAQVPQGIPYQSIIRDGSGNAVANQSVRLRFSIHDSIAAGTVVYQETFQTSTNSLGLTNVNIGMGTVVVGTFSGINWVKNSKFMQVEIDATGGTNFTDMGTTQMMSVPYALYAGSLSNQNYSPSNNNLTVGMNYGGGRIGYILKPSDPGYDPYEQHGLIVAPTDQSSGIKWGGCLNINIGTSATFGSGPSNTNLIATSCGTGTAAKLCYDLVLNGYSDWYLPSSAELIALMGNASISGSNAYWSSSEYTANPNDLVYFYNVPGQNITSGIKNIAIIPVRAVRSF